MVASGILVQVLMDPDNNFVWDVKLPDREETKNSTTTLMSEALMSLAETQQLPDSEDGEGEGKSE